MGRRMGVEGGGGIKSLARGLEKSFMVEIRWHEGGGKPRVGDLKTKRKRFE